MKLPGNILDQNLPPFDEPWQAQAYAMTQVLIENGSMKAEDWASAFGAAIRARLKAGAEDTTGTYFAAIGDALASVLTLDGVELDQTISGWRNAYESTPHGRPVVLANKT